MQAKRRSLSQTGLVFIALRHLGCQDGIRKNGQDTLDLNYAMPISFAFDGDDVIWTQRLSHPTVYLDTCAIRAIGDSDELSQRFSSGLQRQGGTWLLAAICLGEFARFSDPRHAERAERLLALIVPHIYLFASDLNISGWNSEGSNLTERPFPPPDRANLEYFSRRWVATQDMQEVFRGMFRVVHERRVEMTKVLDDVGRKIVSTLGDCRRTDSYRLKAKAARVADGRSRQCIISGELLRDLVLNRNAPILANDGIDLIHAVDAVDYCDLVVLDKAWERRVRNLHKSISSARLNMPIAQCFRPNIDGIEAFLHTIEQWPIPDVATAQLL